MDATQGKQGSVRAEDEPDEERGSYDDEFEEAFERSRAAEDRRLDDPRHGQAGVLSRRIE